MRKVEVSGGRSPVAFAVVAVVALVALAVACVGLIPATPETAVARGSGNFGVTGEVAKPGVTTWQYGTHTITDPSGTLYALRSESVGLDRYVGERVTVSGSVVPGYEQGVVEDGPALVEVAAVEDATQSPGGDQYPDERRSPNGDQYSTAVPGEGDGGTGRSANPADGVEEEAGLPDTLPDTGGSGPGVALLAAGLVAGAFFLRGIYKVVRRG